MDEYTKEEEAWRELEASRSRAKQDQLKIDTVLDERGKRYGAFRTHAEITQMLKSVMFNTRKDLQLAADQREALEMIAHKIGRIVNGDPDYADSWVDIAGYAQLVADRLQGRER